MLEFYFRKWIFLYEVIWATPWGLEDLILLLLLDRLVDSFLIFLFVVFVVLRVSIDGC